MYTEKLTQLVNDVQQSQEKLDSQLHHDVHILFIISRCEREKNTNGVCRSGAILEEMLSFYMLYYLLNTGVIERSFWTLGFYLNFSFFFFFLKEES